MQLVNSLYQTHVDDQLQEFSKQLLQDPNIYFLTFEGKDRNYQLSRLYDEILRNQEFFSQYRSLWPYKQILLANPEPFPKTVVGRLSELVLQTFFKKELSHIDFGWGEYDLHRVEQALFRSMSLDRGYFQKGNYRGHGYFMLRELVQQCVRHYNPRNIHYRRHPLHYIFFQARLSHNFVLFTDILNEISSEELLAFLIAETEPNRQRMNYFVFELEGKFRDALYERLAPQHQKEIVRDVEWTPDSFASLFSSDSETLLDNVLEATDPAVILKLISSTKKLSHYTYLEDGLKHNWQFEPVKALDQKFGKVCRRLGSKNVLTLLLNRNFLEYMNCLGEKSPLVLVGLKHLEEEEQQTLFGNANKPGPGIKALVNAYEDGDLVRFQALLNCLPSDRGFLLHVTDERGVPDFFSNSVGCAPLPFVEALLNALPPELKQEACTELRVPRVNINGRLTAETYQDNMCYLLDVACENPCLQVIDLIVPLIQSEKRAERIIASIRENFRLKRTPVCQVLLSKLQPSEIKLLIQQSPQIQTMLQELSGETPR